MNLNLARVVDLCEYAPDKAGFAIEYPHYISGHDTYAIPAWDERNLSCLAGPFASRADAQAALDLELSFFA